MSSLEVRINALENRIISEISPLELIEKIELVVLKLWNPKSKFSNTWKNVFTNSNINIADALITWYNSFWHTESFIRELLYGSGREAIYKYIIREYESFYHHNIIHKNSNLQFEHTFPVNPKINPPTPYGFTQEREYQHFCGKIDNRNFLDGKLNDLISNDFPDVKTQPYVTQSYVTQRGMYHVDINDQVKSTIQIGNDFQLIGTKNLFYQPYLKLRGIELTVFAIERFF